MTAHVRLEDHLASWAKDRADRVAIAATVGAIGKACAAIADMVANGDLEGDLAATSQGEMLSAQGRVEGSAGYVALERVSGTLHGRRGTFVLQHR